MIKEFFNKHKNKIHTIFTITFIVLVFMLTICGVYSLRTNAKSDNETKPRYQAKQTKNGYQLQDNLAYVDKGTLYVGYVSDIKFFTSGQYDTRITNIDTGEPIIVNSTYSIPWSYFELVVVPGASSNGPEPIENRLRDIYRAMTYNEKATVYLDKFFIDAYSAPWFRFDDNEVVFYETNYHIISQFAHDNSFFYRDTPFMRESYYTLPLDSEIEIIGEYQNYGFISYNEHKRRLAYNEGYSEGFNTGSRIATDEAFNNGFNTGYNQATSDRAVTSGFIPSILGAVVNFFLKILEINFFGIELKALFGVICVMVAAYFVVTLIRG